MALELAERLAQVGDQVLDVLDADGQAYEAVRDADAQPLRRLDDGVRHRDRVRDQRLDGAQILGERAEPHGIHELLAGLDSALDLEPQHRAEAARLLFRERVLREALEARVRDTADLRMLLEELRDRLRVRRLPLET